jgi:hypothetical protein
MNQIITQTNQDLGIRQAKFYTFNGEVPVEMLNFIDVLNTALDLPALNNDQVMLLAKFVMYEFSTLTISEIEKAVFMAKAGKFHGCNSSDYNKLGIDFMGRVLHAYIKNKKNNNLIKEPVKKEEELFCDINDPKKAYEFIKNIYEKEGKEPFIANWNHAFFYMEKEGKIKLSNDEKNIFAENLHYEMKDEAEKLRKMRDNKHHHLREILKSKILFKIECRKRLVKIYFEGKSK